jgi:methionine-rich copper-binding protein CopC
MAHADYDRSDPAADAVIPVAPDRVDVWFTEDVRKVAGANSLEVIDPNGQVVSGELAVDDDDRTHVSVPLNTGLPEGVYTVNWMTTSDHDGDTEDGSFTFTLSSAATVTATATPTANPTAPDTQTPAATTTATSIPAPPSAGDENGAPVALIVILVVAGLAVIGGGAAFVRRR